MEVKAHTIIEESVLIEKIAKGAKASVASGFFNLFKKAPVKATAGDAAVEVTEKVLKPLTKGQIAVRATGLAAGGTTLFGAGHGAGQSKNRSRGNPKYDQYYR